MMYLNLIKNCKIALLIWGSIIKKNEYVKNYISSNLSSSFSSTPGRLVYSISSEGNL